MPPSSNKNYKPFMRNGKAYFVPNSTLTEFKLLMDDYPFRFPQLVRQAYLKAQEWKNKELELEFHSIFYFRHSDIYTKKNKIKKCDLTNRIKSCHDTVCKMLGLDDSQIFRSVEDKKVCPHGCDPYVLIDIHPIVRI